MGSGKDTVADYLCNVHGFRRESFAGSLKDAVAAVFGWDRVMLEGRTTASRAWREQPDAWWSHRLGREITPRWVLQYWGTEVCRSAFHDDIWIASIEHKILNSADNIVISDCRFPNEISAIKQAGGIVIRTCRGPDPAWYHAAEVVNHGPTQNLEWASNKSFLDTFNVHASETAWVGTNFDYHLGNNSTMDELFRQVEDIVHSITSVHQLEDLPAAKVTLT